MSDPNLDELGATGPRPATGAKRRGLREPVNSVTHMIGAGLAVIVTVVLLFVADGGVLTYFALSVFGLSSVMLFTASTLLHAVRAGPVGEVWLRRFDHAAIFVLIAGTYTPVLLLALRHTAPVLAWWLFGVVWLIALAGVIFKLYWITAPRWLSTGLYLAMGWLVVLAIVPVARALGVSGMVWLGLGGFFYTVGAVIYGSKRPNPLPGVLGFHEIWHLFVLAGWAANVVMVFQLALKG